jgi:nucleotide-binding universal stress UspA family protein
MFKHVLIPTDGSRLARKAIKAGIKFAQELGAKVTAYHSVEALQPYVYDGYVDTRTIKTVEEQGLNIARKHVAEIESAAKAAGVPCETLITRPSTTYEGIIDAAKKKKCDVIFMASHGRGELTTLLLGSVTQKVLAHSKIPVLVYR